MLPELRKQLPDGTIRLAGSADRLDQIVGTIGKNFILALFVLLLLMAAMFKSLRHAVVVVLTVPLALIGGMLGLRVLGLFAFQPLDLLSMIGFIMMVGVVVNHAILLVDLTRTAQENGASLDDAIRMSLNQRLRAILASTLTGALGALPMAVNPGPGSVIYRGLAAVNVGGVVDQPGVFAAAAAEPDAPDRSCDAKRRGAGAAARRASRGWSKSRRRSRLLTARDAFRRGSRGSTRIRADERRIEDRRTSRRSIAELAEIGMRRTVLSRASAFLALIRAIRVAIALSLKRQKQ